MMMTATEDAVTLNWVFFDKLRPKDNVRVIRVPRTLFDGIHIPRLQEAICHRLIGCVLTSS